MPVAALIFDRVPMSQPERDLLMVLHSVRQGDRAQAQAARILGYSVRQVRRLQRRLISPRIDRSRDARGRLKNAPAGPAHFVFWLSRLD